MKFNKVLRRRHRLAFLMESNGRIEAKRNCRKTKCVKRERGSRIARKRNREGEKAKKERNAACIPDKLPRNEQKKT